jgi:hypothetical protein
MHEKSLDMKMHIAPAQLAACNSASSELRRECSTACGATSKKQQ